MNIADAVTAAKGLAMTSSERYNGLVSRLMDHVERGTTDWAEDTMRVPAAEYTDERIWKQEVDSIFKSLPIMVGASQEIPDPGDFKTLDILGIPLLITRLADGGSKVLLNVCTHRSMTLVTEPSGNKRVFSCPYHAWSFTADGKLRAVAEARKFGEDCRGDRDLVAFPSHEEGGLIFAVLDARSPADIRAYLGQMMDDIVAKGAEDWCYLGNRVIRGANWKVALDGYLEGYHFKAAHPQTIEPRTFSNIMEFDHYGPHLLIGFAQKEILKLRGVPRDDLWKHENDGYDFIRLIFPNVSVFIAPEIIQVAQIIPGPNLGENTTVLHFFHADPAASEEQLTALNEMADWLKQVVEEEDYLLGLQVQRGLQSGCMKDTIFGRNERGNQFIHRQIRYYRDGPGQSPEPKL